MKKVLVLLIVAAFIPAFQAFAQDEGRHGRHSEDGGGFNNPNPGGGDKGGDSGRKEEALKDNPDQTNVRQQKNQRQHTPAGVGNHKNNGNPNWGANRQADHSNPNFNQRQGLQRQSNQGLDQNRKRDTQGNRNNNQGSFGRDNARDNGRHFGWNQKNKPGDQGHGDRAALTPKLQKWGIKSVPSPIRDHSQMMVADRKHSMMTPPHMGPANQTITAKAFSPRSMSGRVVQSHMMSIANNASFRAQINVNIANETRANNYYWHSWNGVSYCHYYDNWGYHWYGWYVGPNYFWTRWYGNNWWWYDDAYDRWCYWHDGGWWWQDPYHVNAIYVYNNGNYSSVDSTPSYDNENAGGQTVYQSNDGARKIKVMGDGQDAFLYDTSNNPSFDPVYLASGVKEVKFSDTSNGSALQIMLTLRNGTFELFDAYGNRYHGGDSN